MYCVIGTWALVTALGWGGVGLKVDQARSSLPLGAEKWMTFPSSLNILTSSMAWMGCTLSFFSDVCSFLSSVPLDLCTFFALRRGVPLALFVGCVSKVGCEPEDWLAWGGSKYVYVLVCRLAVAYPAGEY